MNGHPERESAADKRRHRHRFHRRPSLPRWDELAALELAGGDRRRLRWITPSVAVVRLRPRGGRRRRH